LFPHFFPASFPPEFRRWLSGLLDVADRFVTISENSRRDLLDFARAWKLALPHVDVIRLGDTVPVRAPVRPPAELLARVAPPAPFVLAVGTVEVRKNHALIYQVWRRLAEECGPSLPPLVIAGQRGWLCEELQYQMRLDPAVDGKIILLAGLHDGELNWLYDNCLFTLYPSHYEGWGLPVCESLAHGKYCIISDRSSLPEIAGDLVSYHDPLDFAACKGLVARALFDDGYRREREAEIRRRYRTTSWADCARGLWMMLRREVNPHDEPLRRCA
jgi:glycosyltransferase involved in cell wall biosynthesis